MKWTTILASENREGSSVDASILCLRHNNNDMLNNGRKECRKEEGWCSGSSLTQGIQNRQVPYWKSAQPSAEGAISGVSAARKLRTQWIKVEREWCFCSITLPPFPFLSVCLDFFSSQLAGDSLRNTEKGGGYVYWGDRKGNSIKRMRKREQWKEKWKSFTIEIGTKV